MAPYEPANLPEQPVAWGSRPMRRLTSVTFLMRLLRSNLTFKHAGKKLSCDTKD